MLPNISGTLTVLINMPPKNNLNYGPAALSVLLQPEPAACLRLPEKSTISSWLTPLCSAATT
jgi:hypothetical protein